MPLGDSLREDWRERARSVPVHPLMDLTEEGLVLGAGTILVKRRTDCAGMPELALDGAEEHVLALLAVAYGKAVGPGAVGPGVLGNIHRASAAWSNGETALALIHLARSRLPRLPDGDAAPFRLFAADRVLAAGIAPRELLKACGLDTGPLDLWKAGYNPDGPRVPAGNPDDYGLYRIIIHPDGTRSRQPYPGRVIDLSKAAFKTLTGTSYGKVMVTVRVKSRPAR